MHSVISADGNEQVAIDIVQVGDFVWVRAGGARCVIAKRAKVNARTQRIVGWLVELTGGELVWWSRGAAVWRQRTA